MTWNDAKGYQIRLLLISTATAGFALIRNIVGQNIHTNEFIRLLTVGPVGTVIQLAFSLAVILAAWKVLSFWANSKV
jgi:hypothetical protein